jgi:flagellar hook-length control protein FliK
METQPTQQGLMQLFMSLGLSTADSLTMLGEGENPEASGFDSLLAGYLPDTKSANGTIPLPTDVDSLLTDQLTMSGEGLDAIGLAADDVEGLPLLYPVTGEELPLSELPIAKVDSSKGSLAAINAPMSEADEKVQALLEDQGFYAQSLVSSTLTNTSAINNMASENMSSQSAAGQSRMTAISEQGSAAHALASLQARGAVSNKALTDTAAQPSIAEADELAMDDDPTMDRFLGAARKNSDTLPSSLSSLSSTASSTLASPLAAALVPAQLTATAESNLSLALSLGEDPIQQSLQDLTAVKDGEETEIDAKLLSTERKQDDQTLKLSKGQQAWGDALSERISMNAAQNIKQVTIHLDPPELGSLELKLQIKDDQQTQVQVQVQNPQVKEALESSAHRLREMLASEGLELAEFDVQTGAEQNAGEQQESNQELAEEQQNSDTLFIEGEETLDINLPKNNNLLDTFV